VAGVRGKRETGSVSSRVRTRVAPASARRPRPDARPPARRTPPSRFFPLRMAPPLAQG